VSHPTRASRSDTAYDRLKGAGDPCICPEQTAGTCLALPPCATASFSTRRFTGERFGRSQQHASTMRQPPVMAVSRLLVTGALDLISNPVALLRRTASSLIATRLAAARAPPRCRCISTAAAAARNSHSARGVVSQSSHPVTAGYATSGVFRGAGETLAAAMLPAPAPGAWCDPCGALASLPSDMVRSEGHAAMWHARTTFDSVLLIL